jgi:hypothetical protein
MRYIVILLFVSCADWSFNTGQYDSQGPQLYMPDNHCTTDEQCQNGAVCVKQYGYVGLCARMITPDGGLTD